MDSLTYCQELAHHGYGFALYYPEHSGCLVPGAVGYFNEDGVFIRVSSVPSLSPRKCFITTHFGPKCSRRTEVNEVEAGLRGSIPISPFPITVDIAYLYRSLVEKGAILITRGQITQKNIDIDNDHAFDWIDANQADIVGSNPAAFERDLWLVTQTITAKGASTKAWKDGQKRHCIGFKIGARDFQVTLPSWDHYVMRMGGTDLQGWNDHNINTPPTFPTDWVISFFLCLGLASALLGHRIVFLSLALLAWCLNRKFVLSNEEMVIFMNGYLFRLENKNKKLKNTRFRREYALKTVLGTFWRRGTYMGAQPPLSHSSRRDFEALNRTIRGETRGGDWSATRGGIKVRLPLQVKEPTGFDHAESDFLLYPSRRRLRDIERIKKFEDSLGLCDGIDKLEMSISAPLNVPNYLKPTQVDESGDQNGSFDIYGQSKESRARRLLIAAGTGNLDTVNHLLRDIDANVCAETFGQRTALQVASNNGSPETVKSLLDANADPNCEVSEWDGRSPLRAASENGHLKVAKELVIKEAKAAAENRKVDVVKFLLEKDADPNAAPAEVFGLTALQAAAQSGNAGLVQTLLDAQAAVDAMVAPADLEEALDDTTETHAIQCSNSQQRLSISVPEVKQELMEVKEKLAQEKVSNAPTALVVAAAAGHNEVVDHLLDAKADVNTAVLQAAAEKGYHKIVEKLLEARVGKDTVAQTVGPNAIREAAIEGNMTALRNLVESLWKERPATVRVQA